MTINVNCPPRGLFIGRETENVSRTLTVDFSAWAAEHGPGTLQVLLQRPGDTAPYPVTLTVDGTVATWKPSETDLAEAGTGAVQIIYTVGDVRVKTSIIPVMVEPSLGVETDPPEGWTSWIDQLTDLAAVTEQHAASAAESAENAGDSATDAQRYATDAGDAKNAAVAAAEAAAVSASHYPQIVNGVWYVWSPSAGAYISTGIDAQGEDGVSPTVEITAIQGGHRVVITDAEGSHTFDVMDGVTPDLSAYRTAADQDEIDDAQDEELNNLKSALDTKAGIIRDTASGAIASFVPDSTIDNLLGVSVDIEPVQDLHGYDSPWPAGGGKNLFDQDTVLPSIGFVRDGDAWFVQNSSTPQYQIIWENTSEISGSVTLTYTYKYSTTSAQGVRFRFEYTNGTATDNYTAGVDGYYTRSFTSDSAKTLARIRTTYGTGSVSTWFKDMQVNFGAAIPYSPYSNICPISGRESVEVEATGINVWDEEWEPGAVDVFDGSVRPASNTIRSKNYCGLIGGSTYYTTCGKTDGGNQNRYYIGIIFYDAEKRYISGGYFNNLTFRAPENARYFKLTTNTSTVVYGNVYNHDISINYPATDHAYHPYSGNHYTIQLGDTVYGGTLDVTNGTLTVDKAMVDLGTLAWNRTTSYSVPVLYTNVAGKLKSNISMLCSIYKFIGNFGGAGGFANASENASIGNCNANEQIYVRDDSYTDVASFASAMSGVQLCYELATPIVIDLDPVTIATIANQTNNVWADAGDVTVEFAADLKTYIDQKIAAAVAALS